jgi:hypothetical protein
MLFALLLFGPSALFLSLFISGDKTFLKVSPDRRNYWCRPSQAVANAKCIELNKGTGWTARDITDEGRFQCHKSRQQMAREADAYCRNLYKSRYVRVEFNRDGQVVCRHCEPGQIARGGLCYNSVATPSPRIPRIVPQPRVTIQQPRAPVLPPRAPLDTARNPLF